MEKEELKELFCAKISLELGRFKQKMLKQSAETVYEKAFQIDCMINIYELLLEMSQETEEKTLKKLLVFPSLLAFLYSKWLKTDDSHTEELQNALEQSISEMEQKYQVIEQEEKAA